MLSRRCFACLAMTPMTSGSSSCLIAATSAFLIAAIVRRRAVLRVSSLWRMASFRSSASWSFRDMAIGRRGSLLARESGCELAAQSVLEALAALGGGFLLAVDARRFVVFAASGFGQDTGLLYELVESLQ